MPRLSLLVACFSLCCAWGMQGVWAQQADAPALADSITATSSGALTGYHEAYYLLDVLNEGLPDPSVTANLQTPQATLEYFVQASRAQQFEAAAAALNLNLFPIEQQVAAASTLARQLFYLLDTQVGLDWEGLPDRPDGASTQPLGPNDRMAGQPRRSLLLGSLSLGGRDAVLRFQRVRVGDATPIWVFSAQTVENIPALYQRYGPGPIDRLMPAWAKVQLWGQTPLWAWLLLLLSTLVLALFAWWLRRFTKRYLGKADSHWVKGLGERIATPVAIFVSLLPLYLVAKLALALPQAVTTPLLILFMAAFVWLAMRAISYLTEHIARDYEVDNLEELAGNEDTRSQRWLTYLSVGRRVLIFVVFLLGTGVILSQFQSFQVLGFSLMASAGVATVILGVAAQPVLGNIIASIQIAVTRPVRIGDSVYYEGQWGYVEEITYTYILIQIWDQRRIVVPLRYFITHPFENWTMRSAHLIKPIYLYADYTLDVDRIREQFKELLQASEDWDKETEPTVQVTSVSDETIEVRALCSAKDASTAWDLHCRLREQLVAYLRDLEDGRYLPRRRINLTGEEQPPVSAQADHASRT